MAGRQTATWAPLASLAMGAFGIGVTEFAPMGLLPRIAEGVHVSIPQAGLLVSGYALGVMVGAPIMTLGLGRLSQKSALILLMMVFTGGNILSAVAPGYAVLMTARVVTSLAHGAFFGIGSVVAARIVGEGRDASGVAAMFFGLTIANVGGVPAITAVGNLIGWRPAFIGIAGTGVAAIIALWFLLPNSAAGERPEIRKELRILTRWPVLLALAATIFGAGPMFTLYTYISPVLTDVTHASQGFVTGMLVLTGLGFTIGNYAGGKFADISVDRTVIACLAAVCIVMMAMPFALGSPIGAGAGILLWSAANFVIVPAAQLRVMQAATGAEGLASSINIGVFNFGNALGAAVGGGVIASGAGYRLVPVAGGILAGIGLLIVVVSPRLLARRGDR